MKILLEQHPNNKIYFSFEGQNQRERNLIKTLKMFHYVENLNRVINDEYKNSKKYRRMINRHILSRGGKNKKEICLSILNDIILPTTDIFLSNAPGLMDNIKLCMKPFIKAPKDIMECADIQSVITNIIIVLALEQITGQSFYIKEFAEGTY